MSFKNVLRARFRSSADKDRLIEDEEFEEVCKDDFVGNKGSPNSTPERCSSEEELSGAYNSCSVDAGSSAHSSPITTQKKTEGRTSPSPASSPKLADQKRSKFQRSDLTRSFKNSDEKLIFENQLTQLQEQLVAAMIENQALKSELNEYCDHSSYERLRQQLQHERKKSQVLEDKFTQFQKSRKNVQRSRSELLSDDVPSKRLLESNQGTGEGKSLARTPSRLESFYEWVTAFAYGVMDDLSDHKDSMKEEEADGDPLAVKTLKENIKRFGVAGKPYLNIMKGMYNLISWKSPAYTLLVFLVYMYSLWLGWLLPLVLLLIVLRLTINYLQFKGLNITLNYFDPGEDEKETEESKDLGVHDKFNLVLQVARRVQNALGLLSDSLEKIKSLLTWRHRTASQQLFTVLCLALSCSLILSASWCFYLSGLYLGVKFFVTDNIFDRFPRLKKKYDTVYKLWRELPTDSQYEKLIKPALDKYILYDGKSLDEVTMFELSTDEISTDDKSFCELFSLPSSEHTLSGWQGGRRCTLINKDRRLTSGAFKHGRLYLTRSYLCFEKSKVPSDKNIVIPLADIIKVEKAKPFAWMPGGGMSIEISVTGVEKVYIFGALLNREEVFESILNAGHAAALDWAEDTITASPIRRQMTI